ncbi:MAG: YIP1 family protein [Candidatus Aenigmatarchaeota archaeon]
MKKVFDMALNRMFDVEKYLGKKTEKFMETTKFIALVSVIPAVILAIATYVGYGTILGTIALPELALAGYIEMAAATVLIGTIISAILFLVIGAIVIYIFAMLLGGKGKYDDSVAALAAALNPVLLLGWIPFINIIAIVFSPAVLVYGVAKKHRLSMFKAAIAIAIPSIIIALIGAYVATVTIPAMVQSFIPGFVG